MVLPAHIEVSLRWVIRTHRLPAAARPHESPCQSPVTSWHEVVIHQTLGAQHQTCHERLALAFYCLVLAFPVCGHLRSTKPYTVYKCFRVLAFSSY